MSSLSLFAHASKQMTNAEVVAALDRDDFELWFQPIVCLRTLEVRSFEGLARVRDADGSVVSPAHFIPAIESDAVLYTRFTDRMIEQAVDFVARCRSAGAAPQVTVNLAEPSLRDDGLVDRVAALLADAAVEPRLLMFEITEREFIDSESAQSEALQGLSELGVGLAIDDFGTGWSSLDTLRWLPVSQLKIDGCFLDRIAEHAADRIIVEKVIELAQSLHLLVIAEGIECAEQLAVLRSAGCNRGQGFLFSPAVPAEDAVELALGGVETSPSDIAPSPSPAMDTGATTPFTLAVEAEHIGDVLHDSAALGTLALQALDVMPLAVFIKDLDGRIVWSSENHWRRLGASTPDDILDHRDLDLHRVDEALRYRFDDLNVMTTGVAVVDRREFQATPDGRRIALRTSKFPVRNRAGAIVGLVGFSVECDVVGSESAPALGSEIGAP